MTWLLVPRQDHRRAVACVGAGVGAFVTGGLAGGFATPGAALIWVTAGFVSFVLCVCRATVLWRLDDMVFDHRRPRKSENPDSARAFRSVREQRAGLEQSWRIS